ncbi:MAG: MBL fold metallo-hydrolase [Proteobacteria bacterium]|nr:MBL fold metallo-hydrolase [Pseudomonadota bacterium]MBU1547445.1 MBL fold metallo-hydrolase [Pseudomonadota bacterium]MBU2619918.1 MBL fold metallo-hydrolase [Pseudomonadota bacterium]
MDAREPFLYTANELFDWISGKPDFILLDVRNEKDFSNWSVEGPTFFPYLNIPYFNFMEDVQGSIDRIPKGEKVRIVCAKEGSAKYVADLLCQNGCGDVGYLKQGIVSWGNVLAPKKVTPEGHPYTVYQFVRPGKASCSYLLIHKNEAMVFDPSRNIEAYKSIAAQHGSTIIASFETHRQADYISGTPQFSEEPGCTAMVNSLDFEGAVFPCKPVTHEEIYTLGGDGPKVKALHTPGHTMGSTCYLIDDTYLVSGDTIFINTAGRPDLGGRWQEWARELYITLMLRLRGLDDGVLVLPGHYTSWGEANCSRIFSAPLGQLRESVIAFRLPNEKKFADFIQDNMRPQPGVYAEIRRVNGGWLKVSQEEADTMDLGKNECGASNYGKVGVSAEVQRCAV